MANDMNNRNCQIFRTAYSFFWTKNQCHRMKTRKTKSSATSNSSYYRNHKRNGAGRATARF